MAVVPKPFALDRGRVGMGVTPGANHRSWFVPMVENCCTQESGGQPWHPHPSPPPSRGREQQRGSRDVAAPESPSPSMGEGLGWGWRGLRKSPILVRANGRELLHAGKWRPAVAPPPQPSPVEGEGARARITRCCCAKKPFPLDGGSVGMGVTGLAQITDLAACQSSRTAACLKLAASPGIPTPALPRQGGGSKDAQQPTARTAVVVPCAIDLQHAQRRHIPHAFQFAQARRCAGELACRAVQESVRAAAVASRGSFSKHDRREGSSMEVLSVVGSRHRHHQRPRSVGELLSLLVDAEKVHAPMLRHPGAD